MYFLIERDSLGREVWRSRAFMTSLAAQERIGLVACRDGHSITVEWW